MARTRSAFQLALLVTLLAPLLPALLDEPLLRLRARFQQHLEDVLPPGFDLGVLDLGEPPEELFASRQRHRQVL